jgi:rhamnosyltransferase
MAFLTRQRECQGKSKMGFNNSSSIAAYITVYQDIHAFYACIQSLQSQPLKAIYILDNSPSPLPLPASQIPLYQNPCPQNIGIGEGINLALQWATQQNYHFLWLFDQDSQPGSHCLQTLLNLYLHLKANNIEPGILAPTALTGFPPMPVLAAKHDRYRFIGQPHQSDRSYYPCIAPITSGSLVNLATVKTIVPNPDLFIDGVDIEYGMRLHQAGYANYIANDAILYHHFGNPCLIEWFGETKILQNYSTLRYYYICRNHTYLDIKYSQGLWKIAAIVFRLKYLAVTLFWILAFLPDSKWSNVWACCKGTYHGFRNKLGKNHNFHPNP